MKHVNINESIERAQQSAPVDVVGLCAELGVKIHYAYLDEDISGELVPLDDGGYQINVNEKHPATRKRFTIAHELGHYIYHKNLIGTGVDDTRAYRSTDLGRYHNTSIGQKQETEANRFAAGLLMPKKLLHEYNKSGFSESNIAELADIFEVSASSMRIRLNLE